jgi:hypothetical protein
MKIRQKFINSTRDKTIILPVMNRIKMGAICKNKNSILGNNENGNFHISLAATRTVYLQDKQLFKRSKKQLTSIILVWQTINEIFAKNLIILSLENVFKKCALLKSFLCPSDHPSICPSVRSSIRLSVHPCVFNTMKNGVLTSF